MNRFLRGGDNTSHGALTVTATVVYASPTAYCRTEAISANNMLRTRRIQTYCNSEVSHFLFTDIPRGEEPLPDIVQY